MGLFSNNKKLCPICGSPTPRLLATKVEGTPICKECDKKVDLPDGMIEQMSIDSFRQYISFYEENQALRDAFTETFRYDFGFLGRDILLDAANGLIRFKNDENALVIEASCIKGFRILEDASPLYESGNGVLKCYQSEVPARANAMSAQIAQLVMQQRQYEQMERRAREDGSPMPVRPYIEMPAPFRHFCVELKLEHPYWRVFGGKKEGPAIDPNYPSIESYLKEYGKDAEKIHALATNLMQMICPGAQEVYGNAEMGVTVQVAASQSAPTGNAIDEIQNYKALFDSGVITEEEFAAKKRQLLGI